MEPFLAEDKSDLKCCYFELVILASQRCYDLKAGSSPEVEHEGDDTDQVIALRELCRSKLDVKRLYRSAFRRMESFSGCGFSDIPAAEPATKKASEESASLEETFEDIPPRI